MISKYLDNFIKSVLAGLMITIGATVYLSCPNKIIGSFMFSIGLITICLFNMNLFTGKIGFVKNREQLIDSLITYVGNIFGCVLFSFVIRFSKTSLHLIAEDMIKAKFSSNVFEIIASSFFCGVLMYIAVKTYKDNKENDKTIGIIGIILCVAVFIVCGFEHSIADVAYFTIGINNAKGFIYSCGYITVVSVFNGIGALTVSNLLEWKK